MLIACPTKEIARKCFFGEAKHLNFTKEYEDPILVVDDKVAFEITEESYHLPEVVGEYLEGADVNIFAMSINDGALSMWYD